MKHLEYLILEENSGILRISLNRPDKRNALNPSLLQELRDILAHYQDRIQQEQHQKSKQALRAVFLTGEGSSFCAGADLDYMKRIAKLSEKENIEDASLMHDTFMALKKFPAPVVTFVHGSCFAGGLGFLGASDLVVAQDDARFCFTEVKIGLVPAIIADFILQKISAPRLASAILLADVFSAEEAKQMGLVHQVYSGIRREQILQEWTEKFLKVAPQAVFKAKKLMQDLESTSHLLQRKTIVTKMIAEARASQEGQEGMSSFLEKREPSWLHKNS